MTSLPVASAAFACWTFHTIQPPVQGTCTQPRRACRAEPSDFWLEPLVWQTTALHSSYTGTTYRPTTRLRAAPRRNGAAQLGHSGDARTWTRAL